MKKLDMKEFTRFEIWESQVSNLENILSPLGLRKKFLRRKYAGYGVEVKYSRIPPLDLNPGYRLSIPYGMVIIRAKDEGKAEPIIRALNYVRPVFV